LIGSAAQLGRRPRDGYATSWRRGVVIHAVIIMQPFVGIIPFRPLTAASRSKIRRSFSV